MLPPLGRDERLRMEKDKTVIKAQIDNLSQNAVCHHDNLPKLIREY